MRIYTCTYSKTSTHTHIKAKDKGQISKICFGEKKLISLLKYFMAFTRIIALPLVCIFREE